MFRRCVGCHSQRGTTPTAGGGWVCDDCARSWGVFGSGLRNVAEKGSKKYRETVLCKTQHNRVRVRNYKRGREQWQSGTCVRCGTVVYDARFTA